MEGAVDPASPSLERLRSAWNKCISLSMVGIILKVRVTNGHLFPSRTMSGATALSPGHFEGIHLINNGREISNDYNNKKDESCLPPKPLSHV